MSGDTPLAPAPPRAVTLAGQHFLVCDDKPTFWDAAEAGRWEPETLAALSRLVHPGMTFLDIGAWVGPLTLVAAAQGARVIAVEADPRALELLQGNVAANPDLAGRIETVGRAAAPRSGVVSLGAPRKPGDSMSSVLRADAAGSWSVEAITPPELLGRVSGTALVVKVDIEGGEYDLLPALIPALPAKAVALLVAFHPRDLARAGRSQADIETATAVCRSALADWTARVLDAPGDPPDDPFERAARENVTLLLERSPAGD